ncbi:MAG: response regulator transcription factor [Algicola sp.]|nr:response regulator transcription factor [Algicola sp.]
MKALQIYIVEDEPLIVSTIETALLKQGFKIVGDASNAISALKDIKSLQPDLILIDIQLEGNQDGIDLALDLDKVQLPYVFLSSQTDPDTIERVKYTNPLGYIVKPFTENGLRTNIELAWHKYIDSEPQFLTVKHEGRLHRINQNAIQYLKAFDNYCYIVTNTETFLVPHTLKYISEQIESDNFVKSHRSYVVNLKHVQSVNKNSLSFENENIPLSASQKSLVITKLKSM